MYRNSYSLDVDRNVPSNSGGVSNYSAVQASSGLSLMPHQLPALSSGAYGPSFTPGYVNAPFATPYAVPFSSPELQRQYSISGPLNMMRGSLAQSQQQPTNLAATDNFSCAMITIDGLEKGQGCTVRKGSDAAIAVDLSGTNPYVLVNGGNRMVVTGDPQSQMCNVSYNDSFDTSSFLLQPNGTFNVCI